MTCIPAQPTMLTSRIRRGDAHSPDTFLNPELPAALGPSLSDHQTQPGTTSQCLACGTLLFRVVLVTRFSVHRCDTVQATSTPHMNGRNEGLIASCGCMFNSLHVDGGSNVRWRSAIHGIMRVVRTEGETSALNITALHLQVGR